MGEGYGLFNPQVNAPYQRYTYYAQRLTHNKLEAQEIFLYPP